ncbi:MAG: MazG nucleotide pyrophosphohydrolase domain-containing protein [Candidatus Gracilibacteria bacterium]
MQGLTGLLWLQERNRQFNGGFLQRDVTYYLDGAQDEIAEIRQSLATKNHNELELEIGDLLWDVLTLIHKFDHEGLIDRNRVCPRAVAKFAERMPYNVLGYFEGEQATRDRDWDLAKELQKIRGVDESHELVKKVWQSVKKS